MKILCISDTTESPAFSDSLKKIFSDTDMVISCGDIPEQSYDYITTTLGKEIFYVFGNHNYRDWKKSHGIQINSPYYGNIIEDRCIRTKQGLLIAGLGGSMKYNKGLCQYTEEQMAARIRKLKLRLIYNKIRYGRYLDILVTHAPVYGLDDCEDLCHRGFKCFADFINKYKPKYIVHGHCHLESRDQNRISLLNSTKVINTFGCYLLEDDFEPTGKGGNS